MLATWLTEFLTSTAAIAAGAWLLGALSTLYFARRSENRLFDHRLKLEMEYSLYADLWDKLFELRRAIGDLIDDVIPPGTVPHAETAADRFNAYQGVVRKGEPFMVTEIYQPANEIASLARDILANVRTIRSIDKQHPRSARGSDPATDEKHAETQLRLDQENDSSFETIERLYLAVLAAIRRRVRVP